MERLDYLLALLAVLGDIHANKHYMNKEIEVVTQAIFKELDL